MKKITIMKATASLADYVRGLKNQPLVVTAEGRPVAALVPVDGMDWETLSVGTSPEFLDWIEQSRRKYPAGTGIPIEDVRKEFGLPPYEERKQGAKRGKTTTRRKVKANGRK
jgi:antitoxin (DNA-binding transcriptional repressor) of toxin-antitoxin stability system